MYMSDLTSASCRCLPGTEVFVLKKVGYFQIAIVHVIVHIISFHWTQKWSKSVQNWMSYEFLKDLYWARFQCNVESPLEEGAQLLASQPALTIVSAIISHIVGVLCPRSLFSSLLLTNYFALCIWKQRINLLITAYFINWVFFVAWERKRFLEI